MNRVGRHVICLRYDAPSLAFQVIAEVHVVVAVDQVLESSAWRLWNARSDKDWTFIDCASFVVMQQQGLTDALTTDHHFEQAGFVRLLK